MPAYMIIDITIQDREPYLQYVRGVADIVTRAGGRYLARGGAIHPFAGAWQPDRVILIEFPTIEQAKACFASAEYRALAPLRETSTISRAIFVEGCTADGISHS